MKYISMWEPWASLYVHGFKKIETRDWPTSHQGWLAIYATKGGLSKRKLAETCAGQHFHECLERLTHSPGHILGMVHVVACHPTMRRSPQQPGIFEVLPELGTDREKAFGNYGIGRYGIVAGKTMALPTPIPFASRQGKILELPEEISEEMREQWRPLGVVNPEGCM